MDKGGLDILRGDLRTPQKPLLCKNLQIKSYIQGVPGMNRRNPEDYRSLRTLGVLGQARCDVFVQIYVQSEKKIGNLMIVMKFLHVDVLEILNLQCNDFIL